MSRRQEDGRYHMKIFIMISCWVILGAGIMGGLIIAEHFASQIGIK